MPIEFRCNNCGKLLRTPDDTAGKLGKCPHCDAQMQIPLPGGLQSGGTQPGGKQHGSPSGERTPPASTWGPSAPAMHSPGANFSPPPQSHASSPHPSNQYPSNSYPQPPSNSYASDPYGSNPYAASSSAPSSYGYGGTRPHRGPMVLTLGLLSTVFGVMGTPGFFCCFFYPLLALALGFGIPAVIIGPVDLRAMNGGTMDASGRSLTMSGMILGIIGVALAGLVVLTFVLLVAFSAAPNFRKF